MRANPLLRFSVLSAACVVILGLVLAHVLADGIRARALVDARETAELFATEVVLPYLRPEDLAGEPVSIARRRRLDAIAERSARGGHLDRIKIFAADGQIVYSDDAAIIGRRSTTGKHLRGALAGTPYVEVSEGKASAQSDERHTGQLLEVYVPLRLPGDARATGALEIYAPFAPVAAAINRDERTLLLVLTAGLLTLWLVLFRIVAAMSQALRDQVASSRYEADHDLLTGLPNRRVVQERLEAAIARARRDSTACALLLVDLDGFKELNDTLGHASGDVLLRELGPRLAKAVGDGVMVARLGGDEFAVLVADAGAPNHVAHVAAALQDALGEPFELEGVRLQVTASIGVARFPRHGSDASELMRRADVAMYQAKRARTGCEEYDLKRDGHSRERLALVDELRNGIERGELEVYFQPKAELRDGRISGVEALVRWNHPVRGLLPPSEFLALAEQSGLMRPLTTYVLDRALAQLAAWTELGLELTVAVNLSVCDLLDIRLADVVAEHLAHTHVEPQLLVLEITEDVMMTDPQRCGAVLQRLAAMGVSLSLDDFGTGFSSLAHLRALSVDEIKIDRSFVSRMLDDDRDAAIVRSTIELGRALGLHVVAEGVEDSQTWERLVDYGCDTAQGYLLSRPVPARELTPRLLAAAARTAAA